MNYEQFITEVQKYWDLRDSGLKKQANRFLFAFTKQFKEAVSDTDAGRLIFILASNWNVCGGDSIIFRKVVLSQGRNLKIR